MPKKPYRIETGEWFNVVNVDIGDFKFWEVANNIAARGFDEQMPDEIGVLTVVSDLELPESESLVCRTSEIKEIIRRHNENISKL